MATIPETLNARITWQDARGHTRSGLVYCALPVRIKAGNVMGDPGCVEEDGTPIPPSKIYGAFGASKIDPPAPNPQYRYEIVVPPDIPAPPRACPQLPRNLSSQDDVDRWNRENPTCLLPPYRELCVVTPRPSERSAVIAYNQTHPQCTPIPVPEEHSSESDDGDGSDGEDGSSGSSAGPWLLGLAVVVAGAIVLVPAVRKKVR